MAIGLATSANYGAIAGFTTGLLADIVPPDQTLLGVTAVILTIVGYLCGTVRDPIGLAPIQLFGLLLSLSFLSNLAFAASAVYLDGRIDTFEETWTTIAAVTAYTVGVGLLVLPPSLRSLTKLARRSSRRASTTDPFASRLG